MSVLPELPPLPPNPVTFARPPVAEVALAVQFSDPIADESLILGEFWPGIQTDYPRVEAQHPLPPMDEQFAGPVMPSLSFQILDRAQAGRYWFLNPDQTELVQLQPDRFAFNWRREPANVDYPRYKHIRERFYELYSQLAKQADGAGKSVVPSWCEITYINPIPSDDEGWPDLSSIMRRIGGLTLEGVGSPEDTTLNERYVLSRDGKPYGRFHIAAAPVVRNSDGIPLYLLTLTVRALPVTPDVLGVITLMDQGRDLIVKGFRDMTTESMHEVWGLRDAD